MDDIVDLYTRASERYGGLVYSVRADHWAGPTPCTDWDVRALVNHLASENLWVPPLFEGKTIADVGDRFDGDVLGEDPKSAWSASASPAVAAVQGEGAMGRIVHLSFGDVPGSEYAWQMFADLLIHGWDLARAIGTDESLPPDMIDACARWFDEREAQYRQVGAITDRPDVPPDADAQTVLLARFGRTA
jgi:uncharacterized protein (TIGR03086 family)